MHDFNCTKADDMHFDLMAERTRYLKENPKGVSEMCKAMEDMRNEVAKRVDLEAKKKIACNLLKIGKLTLDEIAGCSELPVEEVRILQGKRI